MAEYKRNRVHNWYASIGRLRLMCLIIGLFAYLCSGCGMGAPAQDPAIIRFAHREDDTAYFEALLPKFNEQYPHITVELDPRSWGALNDVGVEDADVFVVTEDAFVERWEQGSLLNVDPFIAQDRAFDSSDFYPGTVDLFSVEGETWAIPAGVDPLVMYYNQDLFDRYDVDYPQTEWTWDDFLDTALALRDPDADVYGYGPTGGVADPLLFIYQHGGGVIDDLQNPTRTTFDDPVTVQALEWYAGLFQEHDVAPTSKEALRVFGGPAQYSIYRGIQANKVGMWRGSLAERGGQWYWPTEWSMNWGMAPLPRDTQSATSAAVEAYAISSESQHPDASWHWVAFLNEQMTDRLMPVRRSLAEDTAYEQVVGRDVAAVVRESMENAVLISSRRLAGFGRALEAFEEAVGEVINGDATPQGAMEQIQRQSER